MWIAAAKAYNDLDKSAMLNAMLEKLKSLIGGNSVLGIDIGTGAIKAVEIAGGRGGISLVNYGVLNEAPILIAMHDPAAQTDTASTEHDVATLVRDLLSAMKVKSRKAALALPSHTVFFHLLEFPVMRDKELREAVLYQAERIVSVPLAEIVLDWEIVGKREGTPEHAEAVYVLVAAVPREIVDRYVRIGKLAQINVVGLEAEPFSLVRLANRSVEGVYAVLDFGGYRSSLVIAQEGTVRSVHEIELTGSKLTTALAKSLVVDEERAEAMKLEHGLETSGATDLKRTLGPFVDGMVSEIRSAFSKHLQHHSEPVETLVISGGSGQLKGLAEHLAGHFKTQVRGLETFKDIVLPNKLDGLLRAEASEFAVALGLALRHGKEGHRH